MEFVRSDTSIIIKNMSSLFGMKQYENELADIQSALAREKRLRQQGDQYIKQMEDEVEALKVMLKHV